MLPSTRFLAAFILGGLTVAAPASLFVPLFIGQNSVPNPLLDPWLRFLVLAWCTVMGLALLLLLIRLLRAGLQGLRPRVTTSTNRFAAGEKRSI